MISPHWQDKKSFLLNFFCCQQHVLGTLNDDAFRQFFLFFLFLFFFLRLIPPRTESWWVDLEHGKF